MKFHSPVISPRLHRLFRMHEVRVPARARRTHLALLLVLALAGQGVDAAEPARALADYLPADTEYDPSVPKPKDVLGFEPGAWHVRPDQLVDYARAIADASPRAVLEIQGRTHEQRPQPLLIFTSPANHGQLDRLRLAHLALSSAPERTTPGALEAMPLVVLLGFSIHGNEPSGANSAPLLMYHLAAALGGEVEQLLEETIVLVDPSFNPDGLGRFAHWANTNRGHVVVPDPQHREHGEPWPGGRTNHYFFDLNRDWLLAQHPESRNRLRTFHRWRPNVVTDHHEMGTNSTFFFQPGVPIRKNPRIPDSNVELTNAIAAYHARSFDEAGRLYYTEEGFDDFYPGKGSTYPDLHGSVGILFEQASSRGHAQTTDTGVLTFAFTIENQFRAALSTLAGARAHRVELLEHQIAFASSSERQAQRDVVRGFLVEGAGDRGRLRGFTDVLLHHRIEAHSLGSARGLAPGVDPSTTIVVRSDQAQYHLIKTLFERVTDFADSTFYDVSTWNLPMAFGLRFRELDARELDGLDLAERVGDPRERTEAPLGEEPGVAYALPWLDYDTAKVLGRLLRAGVEARVATRSFLAETQRGQVELGAGTILLPRGDGRDPRTALQEALRDTAVSPDLIETGWSARGPDLGSNLVRPLRNPTPLIVSGPPTSAYSAGELWHLLDRRTEMPVSLIDWDDLESADLDDYSHILLPHGRYRATEGLTAKLAGFMRRGGFVIATQGAVAFIDEAFRNREAESGMPPEDLDVDPEERVTFAEYRARRARQLLSGAIFEAELDLTHPLAWGYTDAGLPVFRTSTRILAASDNPFLDVGFYSASPRLSGYASQENIDRIAGTVAVAAGRLGRGGWIQIVDDPSFRAVWWGPSRLVLNALFFAHTIDTTVAPSSWN